MIIARNDIASLASVLHNNGQKIVFTNGCFDLLHKGHITYLSEAASLGDILIVGLNSDSSVKRWKNPNRPIVTEQERAFVLSALRVVDYVVIFNEINADKLLAEIKPDIYVKGGDYSLENLPETATLQKYHIQPHFIKTVPGCSSTNIIKKIKAQ